MKENLTIIHGGGPTAVLNCSLYGAVREAQASGLVEHVYGAVGGTGGLLKEKLLDFGSVPEEELERLPTTPATAIGTSRDALEAEDYARMADILAEIPLSRHTAASLPQASMVPLPPFIST